MNFTPVELDQKQLKRWDETRNALMWDAPAFTHIFYSLLNKVNRKHIALMTAEGRYPESR